MSQILVSMSILLKSLSDTKQVHKNCLLFRVLSNIFYIIYLQCHIFAFIYKQVGTAGRVDHFDPNKQNIQDEEAISMRNHDLLDMFYKVRHPKFINPMKTFAISPVNPTEFTQIASKKTILLKFPCFSNHLSNHRELNSAAQNARRGGEHQKAGDGLGADQLVVAASRLGSSSAAALRGVLGAGVMEKKGRIADRIYS